MKEILEWISIVITGILMAALFYLVCLFDWVAF